MGIEYQIMVWYTDECISMAPDYFTLTLKFTRIGGLIISIFYYTCYTAVSTVFIKVFSSQQFIIFIKQIDIKLSQYEKVLCIGKILIWKRVYLKS